MILDELSRFVTYLKDKGFLNKNTAGSWSRSITAVKKVVEPDEDITLGYLEENVDVLFERYFNKHSNLSPNSIKTYMGAFRSLLKEFGKWKNDKLNYHPSFTSGRTRTKASPKGKRQEAKGVFDSSRDASAGSNAHTLRIALGENRVAELSLPIDLTSEEAALLKGIMDSIVKATKQERPDD